MGADAPFLFALLGGRLWSRQTATLLAREAWKRGPRELAAWFGEALRPARHYLESAYASEAIHALWAPWGLHCGLNPESAYSAEMIKVIAFAIEMAGCPIAVGGAKTLVGAFERLIADNGGLIQCGADVDRVETAGADGRARAVLLASGERIEASEGILCSMTPTQLYGRLLRDHPASAKAEDSLKRYRYGKGDMQIHYALNAPPRWKGGDDLGKVALLHVTPGLDGVSRAANECERGLLPAEPTICVGQPTALDSVAGAGRKGDPLAAIAGGAAPHQRRREGRNRRARGRALDAGDPRGLCRPGGGAGLPPHRELSRPRHRPQGLFAGRPRGAQPQSRRRRSVWRVLRPRPVFPLAALRWLDEPQHARPSPLSDRRLDASGPRAWRGLRVSSRQCAEMSDQTSVKASIFDDHLWLRGASSGLRPTLGQIGLQQFAPYLINSISLSWVTHLASALKAHDMTTTQMRALAVLSISSPVTINELSQFALTEQSTMSRTLDALEEQAFIVRKPRAEDLRVRDVEITQAGRDAFARVWPTMYDLLLKMFDGIDNEEYKAFTATMHKMMSNVRKHEI